MGCMPLFSRQRADALSQMQIHTGEYSSTSRVVVWYPKSSTIWLPCELPNHKPPEDQSRVLAPQKGFTLNVTNSLAPFLRKVSSKNQKLFYQNFEAVFNKLILRLNHENGTTLTVSRVSLFIPGLIAQ